MVQEIFNETNTSVLTKVVWSCNFRLGFRFSVKSVPLIIRRGPVFLSRFVRFENNTQTVAFLFIKDHEFTVNKHSWYDLQIQSFPQRGPKLYPWIAGSDNILAPQLDKVRPPLAVVASLRAMLKWYCSQWVMALIGHIISSGNNYMASNGQGNLIYRKAILRSNSGGLCWPLEPNYIIACYF